MMNQLEVFFDYFCPFCQKGHYYLKKLYPAYPNVEIVWRPWSDEHPRPEAGMCMLGLYFALDSGADIWEYHDRMYQATILKQMDISTIDAFVECFKGLLDSDALREALQNGDYAKAQRDENLKAYEKYGIWEIPAYRMNEMKLDSVLGVNISKDQIKDFIDAAKWD